MRPTSATTIARQGGTSLPLFAFLLLLSVLAVSGCNTVSGVGEDISAAGRGIDQTSERTQSRLTDKSSQQSPEKPQQRSGSDYQAGRY